MKYLFLVLLQLAPFSGTNATIELEFWQFWTDPEIKLYESGGHGFQTLGERTMAEMVKFFKERL